MTGLLGLNSIFGEEVNEISLTKNISFLFFYKNCHCTFLLITGIINILFGYTCLSLGLYVGIDPFPLVFLGLL